VDLDFDLDDLLQNASDEGSRSMSIEESGAAALLDFAAGYVVRAVGEV
jgi:hypothetical protein